MSGARSSPPMRASLQPMAWNALHLRPLLVRLSLLFAIGQLAALVAVALSLPGARMPSMGPVLLGGLLVADLVILGVFGRWILSESVSAPMERLAADVHRIADGDYHYRVGDIRHPELMGIQRSVNRLADRLIAHQRMLSENVESLEESNRALVEAQDQVVRSARMASVGTLAAGIAHEVGNPLGAIMAYVDVAAARVRREGGDTELLDSIRTEANRIDRIVRGLLDYTRPREVEAEPTSVGEILDRVRELLESQGRLEGIDAEWSLDHSEPHIVLEPHRLEQVLVNLILNALHAVMAVDDPHVWVRLYGEEGEVARLPKRREDDPPGINYMHRRRMSRGEGSIDSVSTAERVTVIEVADNGPGIEVDDVEYLFDPFFTTKEPGEGTGLGLSICARLVEGMGGRIDAENASSGGARFLVRLPSVDGIPVGVSVAAQELETT
jgi:two-component system NtrC family sensor kinase